MSMNDLETYFRANTGRQIHKWTHYFEIYDRHFARFRDQPVNVLEFGVSQGGSLQMWKHYFGESARIFGVDINPECKRFEEPRVEVHIGDQGDRAFLRSLMQRLPQIDVLIDDGGHTMKQQIRTFEECFPALHPNGVYLCEDVHTSYWRKLGGGYRRRGSYIEYTKGLIDGLNAWHSEEPKRFAVGDFTRSAWSMHYYDSIVVIERRAMQPPKHEKTGTPNLSEGSGRMGYLPRLVRRLTGRE